jgi:Nucleoside-diphosphate-sugar pyrophosphorylase involved in lipopolysaccharide biosynthesis/translation initiation factor 2B, gamma/epsilon subunits (eIF-2Bgamma/eIF-2Bepsilon)
MKHKTAMILAAGLGTRLKELTKHRPKALVKLNGKPLLLLVINNLRAYGFNHIIVNAHHFSSQIIDFLHKESFPDLKIDISDETELLMDTGGGILKARPFFTQSKYVLIHNVDIICDANLNLIAQSFEQSNDDAWLMTQERNSSRKLLFNDDQQLIGWKNNAENQYKWVDMPYDNYKELSFSGIHIFKPNLFEQLETKPCSIIDLYLELAQKHTIKSQMLETNFWFDLGKVNQLEEASRQLTENRYGE